MAGDRARVDVGDQYRPQVASLALSHTLCELVAALLRLPLESQLLRFYSTYHDGNYDVFEQAQEESQLHKQRMQENLDKRRAIVEVCAAMAVGWACARRCSPCLPCVRALLRCLQCCVPFTCSATLGPAYTTC